MGGASNQRQAHKDEQHRQLQQGFGSATQASPLRVDQHSATSSGVATSSAMSRFLVDGSPPSYRISQARDRFDVANPGFDSSAEPGSSAALSDGVPKETAAQHAPTDQAMIPLRAATADTERGQGEIAAALATPPLTLRGSTPSDHTDDTLLQMLTESDSSTTITNTSSVSPSAAVSCIFGFPVPPRTGAVELTDALPTSADCTLYDGSSMSANVSSSSGQERKTTTEQDLEANGHASAPAPASEQGSLDQLDNTPLSALNAWRRAIRECATFTEAAALRLWSVKQELAQEAASPGVGTSLAISSNITLPADAVRASEKRGSVPAPYRLAGSVISAQGTKLIASSSTAANDGETDREAIENMIGGYVAQTPETTAPAPTRVLDTSEVGNSHAKRRDSFGEINNSSEIDLGRHIDAAQLEPPSQPTVAPEFSRHESQLGSEGDYIYGPITNQHLSAPSHANIQFPTLSAAETQATEQKRRTASSTAVISPFSLSLASNASDEAEYISDELCPQPDIVSDGRPSSLRSDQALEVPASIIKQLLNATVGKTPAPAKSIVHLGPLHLRISTLLNIIGPKTSEVVVDLIGSQITAYLYFIEDSELLAWMTETLYQRRNVPAKQWAQLCTIMRDYRPLKPPQSNFSTYLAAPTRTAILRHLGFPQDLPELTTTAIPSAPIKAPPTAPPASPWRKHLHLFHRRSSHDQSSNGKPWRQTRSLSTRNNHIANEHPRASQEDGDRLFGVNSTELADYIALQVRTRAVDCLPLDVLVAISNLCVHRVFAPILLRRLLAFFALGDTENSFMPVEAEIKLLRDYREQYLRPQSTLLRARIKEFSPELEVEAMLRTFEATMNPRLLMPSILQHTPSVARSDHHPSPAPSINSFSQQQDAWGHDEHQVSQSAPVLCSTYATPLWPCGGVGEAPESVLKGRADPETSAGASIGGLDPASALTSSSTTRKLLNRVGGSHVRSRSNNTSLSVNVHTATDANATVNKTLSLEEHADMLPRNGFERSTNRGRQRRSTTSYSSMSHDGTMSTAAAAAAPSPSGINRKAAPINMVAAIDELVSLRQQSLSAGLA